MINYIYNAGIIDHWDNWTCYFEPAEAVGVPRKMKSINSNDFAVITEFFYKLTLTDDWEGDIRNNTNLYHTTLSGDNFIIGLKQDNNGTTYIGSKHKLGQPEIRQLVDTDWAEVKQIFLPEVKL